MAKMTIDGAAVEAREGQTLLQVLRALGIRVPTLCHHDAVSPYGACRLCVVEVIAGKRTMLAASCLYPVTDGIEVRTASERVLKARRMVAELLLARCPNVPRVREVAREVGVLDTRFRKKDERCVLCGLCVRGCAEIAGVGAIDFASRGAYMEVATPFREASPVCVGCTTCVYICPTDALRIDAIHGVSVVHPRNGRPPPSKCALCGTGDFVPRFRAMPAEP